MKELSVLVKDSNPLVNIDTEGLHQVFLNGVLQRRGKVYDYVLPRFERGLKFNSNLDPRDLVTVFLN